MELYLINSFLVLILLMAIFGLFVGHRQMENKRPHKPAPKNLPPPMPNFKNK
ncbi:MAG: hypothetical protein ACOYL6_10945 [Bacteriovoracaceae bacterium]